MKRTAATIQNFGWGWRFQNGRIEKKDKREVDFCSLPLAAFIEMLHESAAGLTEAHVGMDIEYSSYGERERDRDKLYVEGWREATDEEISAKRAEVDKVTEARDSYLSSAERALRAARPELFKD